MLMATITFTVIDQNNELELNNSYIYNIGNKESTGFVEWVHTNAEILCKEDIDYLVKKKHCEFIGIEDISFREVDDYNQNEE